MLEARVVGRCFVAGIHVGLVPWPCARTAGWYELPRAAAALSTSVHSAKHQGCCSPKKGRVALPGFSGQAPGSGVIMWPPVSVCHQVSTTGHLLSPTTSEYQRHASGLMGSPTEPRMRREDLRRGGGDGGVSRGSAKAEVRCC